MSAREKTAVLLGASGLVGGFCLKQLLDEPGYVRVVSLGRRELPVRSQKLEQYQIDFDRLDRHVDLFRGDHLFCCLGTTMKKAGSKEAFRKVDFEYVVHSAVAGVAQGMSKFLVVSSIGADEKSALFYSRVKGEMEGAVQGLAYREVHLFRPSLLLGERRENRRAERLGAWITTTASPLLAGPLKCYRPVHAKDVAAAMVRAALIDGPPGVHRHEYPDLMAGVS